MRSYTKCHNFSTQQVSLITIFWKLTPVLDAMTMKPAITRLKFDIQYLYGRKPDKKNKMLKKLLYTLYF